MIVLKKIFGKPLIFRSFFVRSQLLNDRFCILFHLDSLICLRVLSENRFPVTRFGRYIKDQNRLIPKNLYILEKNGYDFRAQRQKWVYNLLPDPHFYCDLFFLTLL